MIRPLLFISFLLMTMVAQSQKIIGQWKGQFIDKSSSVGDLAGDKCDYVLELEMNGNKISGSSYTYFTEGGIKYYTICKLEGSFNKKTKALEVKETQRVKTNIPSNIRNCYQVHKLTYFKQGDTETLEGDWMPAPNQDGSCGFGITQLTRRTLMQTYPGFAKNKTASPPLAQKNTKVSPKPSPKPAPKTSTAVAKNDVNTKNQSTAKPAETLTDKKNLTATPKQDIATVINVDPKLEKRKSTVLKTIEVEKPVIRVDLYDNGEIDGDSISLFFNGKLLLSNKKLTDKAITLNLTLEHDDQPNELVMFAENLGAIAPNTALMVVTDGPNRYEIRITSDLEKSGMIRFVHKSPKP